MAQHTINALLSMQKALVQRKQQLSELRTSSTSRNLYRNIGNDTERIEEPTYSLKEVDRKVVDINNALFLIDQKIKESNAKTAIEIDIDYMKLASSVEETPTFTPKA